MILVTRHIAIWTGLIGLLTLPLALAALSPLLAWRQPIYIIAGFAGVVALALLVVQPLLALDWLPGLQCRRGRDWHRWTGILLVGLVIVHVGGLWITSPPDVIDVLLVRSPTPFSIWGLAAMWAVFTSAAFALMRRRLRYRRWQSLHIGLGVVIGAGTVLHALLIDGTMETLSKWLLCAAVIGLLVVLIRRRMG